jgi:phosphatidylserine/phosphatidylglycerophosphate/cardiolipin synthase-like enzyme
VELGSTLPRFELTHLPGLHAKVYPADDRLAVVTSANLTESGITGNCEDTVPAGIEILNFDLLTTDPQAEIPWWSKELRAYWRKNHKAWGRCEPGCPCQRLSSFTSRHDTT